MAKQNNAVLPLPENPIDIQEDLTPEAAANLDEIAVLAQDGRGTTWRLVELVAKHVNEFNLPIDMVARRIGKSGYNAKYLYEYLKVVNDFPTEESREGLQVYSCMEAIKAYKKLPLEMAQQTTPQEIAQKMAEKGVPGKKIRKQMAEQAREVANANAAAASADAIAKDDDIRANCLHGDCRELVRQLDDGSVKMFWADMPYSNYRKNEKTQELVTAGSYGAESRTECDNNEKGKAIAVVLDLLQLCLPKLAEGGSMVIWMAGGIPPPWELLRAAEQEGWDSRFMGLWDKNIPQPGNLEEPFSISSELFLILYRKGDPVLDHSPSLAGRRDIVDEDRLREYYDRNFCRLKYEPVTRAFQRQLRKGEAEVGDVHVMMKPDMINHFFLNKLTYQGDLVVDLFGCSASMSCACMKANRRWRYSESNQKNFDWGVSRLAEAKQAMSQDEKIEPNNADDDIPFG